MSGANEHQLISAGTPADNASIEFLETLTVLSAAVVLGSIILFAWPVVVPAAAVGMLAGYRARRMRFERLLQNETAAREALLARYNYPLERKNTIEGLEAPIDVKCAALELVGTARMTQAEIAARLSLRVGAKRANDYLPLILQQADHSVESPAPGAATDRVETAPGQSV